MNVAELDRQRKKLEELVAKAKSFPEPELQSHWCRYLCILISGFLENAVRITYSEYARKRADPTVADFVSHRLGQFQNPNMQAILDVAGAFSKALRKQLETDTDGQLRESVNSIVSNRHKIAHGESVGLSMQSLTQYYADALKVVQLMRRQCGLEEI